LGKMQERPLSLEIRRGLPPPGRRTGQYSEMNLWPIFAIALAAMVTALVLAYILKSRLGDDDVWEELIDPRAANGTAESAAPPLNEIESRKDPQPEEQVSQFKVEPMTIPASSQSSRNFRGADLRRSSRLEQPISLVVMGTNRRGESFQEKTSAVSFNLHGCRYSSRHDYPSDGWVTLQVTGTEGMNFPVVRARVRSVVLPKSPRELSQVGVELETPANVWGVPNAPEDWNRFPGANSFASAAAAPALAPAPPAAQPERKAEVTVFPSPAVPPEAVPTAATPKPERLVLTPDQLLQALQGKLQQAADRAVQTAISTHLNESVRIAVNKIDDVCKSNVRQAEEFSSARLAEVQNRWERELVVYRSRAEEVSRRLEALAANANQNLAEFQKLAQHLRTEIEPQLAASISESLERARSEFAANVAEISGQHIAQVRGHFDESLTQARALANSANAASAPSAISEAQLQEVAGATRSAAEQHVDERLSEIWNLFEQQQDLARQRTDQLAASLGQLAEQVQQAMANQERALTELRAAVATNASAPAAAPADLEARLAAAKEQFHNDFEWRLGEVAARFEQLHATAHENADALADRLAALAAESQALRSQHEQGLSELRSTVAGLPTPVSQERLDWLMNSSRDQLLHHIEWRIGEVANRSEQQHDVTRRHAEELAQRVEALAASTRAQFEESRALADSTSRSPHPEDLGRLEQTIDRLTREFESSAARVSDRQLIRLTEQKQALASEASLELEARATEARALLQKSANNMLEEFRRRVEVQMDLIAAEATERVSSSLASLDAESRAAGEARRRSLESEVARAAEQSTAEFRSGIKAFLYSCLVAAVSAVDQHAQTTLAGLDKNAAPGIPALENTGNGAPKSDNRSAAANASDSSK